MKVLTITNMYPIHEHKYYGIFVKEQVNSLKQYYPEITSNLIFINGFKTKLNYLKSIFSINFHLLFNKYDIIHIHFGLSGLFTLFNPFIKAPIVTMLHSADIDIRKSNMLIIFITKLVVKRSSFILYLNEDMKRTISNYNSNILYLPCGVDSNFFIDKNFHKSVDSFTIGFPGNPKRPEKNFKLFEEIMEVLRKEKFNCKVVIFHGMTRSEVVDSLNSCDVLVMTSISEGSPQIIKEALSCNIPIVSSEVGDVEVLLNNVKNSFVISSFDPNNFVKKIKIILSEDPVRRKSTGRKKINELKLDHRDISKKIYNVYMKLLNK
ncbi:MAG: glycosyltransferase family 4 protein [Zunongwangia sp.]|uniref:glycosyltransferase family 4 protein n=1 Tax=Zunongwangia sp. TaxID=1965325 RepID=UPI003242E4F3